MLLASFFISCSKDDSIPENTITPPEEKPLTDEEKLQRFYDTKTFGYRVKDTTNLDLINCYEQDEECAILTGIRNKSLWIAKFNILNKEQISEFTDSEEFSVNQKVDLGYGNHEDILISSIQPLQVYDGDDVFIANCVLRGNSNNHKSLLIFSGINARNEYSFSNNSNYLYEWFDNSLAYKHGAYYSLFDKNGNMVHEDIESYHSVSDGIPVSYTDYIWVGFLFPTADTQPTILRTWLGNHSMNTNKWNIWLPILNNKNAKFEYLTTERSNELWTFIVDVTEFSGDKHSHKVVVNIETGELISLNQL